MRTLQHWHGAPLRILRCDCAPSAGPLLPGAPTPLPVGAAAESFAALEAAPAAAMGAALAAFEAQRAAALLPGVRRWEEALDAAVTAGGLDLPKLSGLVESGATAHDLPLADLDTLAAESSQAAETSGSAEPGGDDDAHLRRLQSVHAQWRAASAWNVRCTKVVGGPQSAASPRRSSRRPRASRCRCRRWRRCACGWSACWRG